MFCCDAVALQTLHRVLIHILERIFKVNWQLRCGSISFHDINFHKIIPQGRWLSCGSQRLVFKSCYIPCGRQTGGLQATAEDVVSSNKSKNIWFSPRCPEKNVKNVL